MRVATTMPVSLCTSFAEGGYTSLHAKLEATVADFLGKEAAVRGGDLVTAQNAQLLESARRSNLVARCPVLLRRHHPRCRGGAAQIVFSMGFATNALGIPALGGRGTLLISDSLNHSSIVAGARASGATIRVYKHNDYRGLESVVRPGWGPCGAARW
jgi:7-keto-8-aminopelargonate synthetase-like enzyme